MANEVRVSGVVDPLANYWGLSLFPQSSGVLPDPSKPYNPDEDLDAIHNHLRSMALQSPNKLLEQANSILDGNPGLFQSESLGDPASDEEKVVVSKEAKENPRERRPALGHKRARFSLKPTKNHPTEILIPSLDIDNLKDPEKFFMAYERLENAKREIQKQMGGISVELDQNYTSTNVRERRPGLLGNNQRRSGRYKHRYSLETTDNNRNFQSSQETFESGGLDPVDGIAHKTGAHSLSLQSEPANSSATKENKLNDILDELLHSSCEDLEGDGAISLLQESLQIKPIVLEKLSIPDLPDNQIIDLKSFELNLSKPRKALSNIDNLLKEIHKTPVNLQRNIERPVQQLASPTPPKSPFAPLSSLQKRISQSKPSVDPFSALNSDSLSPRNSCLTDVTNQGLNLVDSGKESDKMTSDSLKDVITISKRGSAEDTIRNCVSTSRKSEEDNSRESGHGTDAVTKEIDVDMEAGIGGSDVGERVVDDTVRRPNCVSASGKSNKDKMGEPGFGTDAGSNESDVMEVEIGGGDMGNGVMDDMAENMHEVVASAPTDDLDQNLVNPLVADQSIPAGIEANAADDHQIRTSHDGLEQCLEAQEKTEGSKESQNKQSEVKLRPRRQQKDKGHSKRQSLAAAGTSWKAGVRRSTRMRSRPLEYWKGERFVYGRVHESLATVIGVKYMSPRSADGKLSMKVKSYVSDEYKELFELASQY